MKGEDHEAKPAYHLQRTRTTPTDVCRWGQELVRLHARLAPRFARPEPRRRVLAYLQGILSDTSRKTGWQLAEYAREARPDRMQRLLGSAVWEMDGVRDDLRPYTLEHLGQESAIPVIDETSSPKRGRKEDRERCQAAPIPETVRFQTKPELAVQMIERIFQAQIPIFWVVADTVYGGNLELRTWLEGHQYPYVLAVACSEPVGFQTPAGRRREEAALVESLVLHDEDWQRLSMSEGTKGPRLFDWAMVPLLHQWEDNGRHWLLIRRSLTDPQEKQYYFVFAPPGTTLLEMVQAIGARWHIENRLHRRRDVTLGEDACQVRMTGAGFRVGCAQWRRPRFDGLAPRPERGFSDAPFLRPSKGCLATTVWQACAVVRVHQKAL